MSSIKSYIGAPPASATAAEYGLCEGFLAMSWLRANRFTRAAFYVSIIDIIQEDPLYVKLGYFFKPDLIFIPASLLYYFHDVSRVLARKPNLSEGFRDARCALRPARWFHLDERQPCRLERSQAACSFARSSLCLLRLRGRARL